MNDEASVYVGGLANEVTENIIEELFVQIGPIKSFTLKKADAHNYALVEFEDEETVPFALEVMDGIKLYNRSITVKPRNNTKQEEVWKKMQSERRDNRRSDSNQPYLPQIDRDSSRKRDYDGESNYNTPRNRNDNSRRPPYPPPPPPSMPKYDSYLTPPPPPPFMGYTPSQDKRNDRWHTPPSREYINPRIPPEYDNSFRDRNRNDYNNSRDSHNRNDYNNSRDRRPYSDQRVRRDDRRHNSSHSGDRRY